MKERLLWSTSFLFVSGALATYAALFFPASSHAPTETLLPFSIDARPAEDASPLPQANILFVGDMMLDRTVFSHVKRADDFSLPFAHLDTFFPEYDLRVGNLEGPVTNFPPVAQTERFTFTFAPEYVSPLAEHFDIVSLANNHTHNFGRTGLAQTREFLAEGGITFFGDPYNDPAHLSVTTTVNGITIGLVGFHELHGSGFDDVLTEVERLSPLTDALFVMPHWGIEYEREKPSAQQRQEAHALIDAGADVIIGAHPHVIQPIELYQDKPIFYSLGNFIFDQYFSQETMEGLAVGVTLIKEYTTTTTAFFLRPIEITQKSQPALAGIERTEAIRSFNAVHSIVPETLKEDISKGYFTVSW